MNPDNRNLKVVVFKACLVAIWTDSNMSSNERQYISHLTEMLGETEKERKMLRVLLLKEVNEGMLLSEIEQLSKTEKEYVFDTCLDALASDKIINLQELRFLGTLRKACDIGYRVYRKKLLRTQQKTKAWVFSAFKAAIIVGFIPLVLLGVVIYKQYFRASIDIRLQGSSSGKEISVSIVPTDKPQKSTLKTGQDVFEHVHNSIVSVTVFINNDPECGGSGSVIGSDESGVLYIITNKHVVHNSDTVKGRRGDRIRVEVQQHSGAKFDAILDFYSRKHDIALLAVKNMEKYARPLQLNLKSNLQVGQPIYAIGSPIGLDHTFTGGVISALRESYLQTDATVHSGSSGGSLVDQRGALCAIVTKGHEAKDFSFALYSDIILEVLKERKKLIIDSPSD